MPPQRDARGRFVSGGGRGGRDVRAEIHGIKETQAKMDQVARDLGGQEMLDGMHGATLIVSRDAKMLSPKDVGQLMNSITPTVSSKGNVIQGIVGSNVRHAPYMELGTGVYAGNAPYFPPPSALETWARRHGTTGFIIARAIFMAGGLKPRRFLQRAFEKNKEKIQQLIGDVVSKIVRK